MDEALKKIRGLARSTANSNVLAEIGGFGGLFRMCAAHRPVLVASVDGVGTKLRVARDAGIHDTVGADLVNHCINDILVQGARPLFFMDYFATGQLEPEVVVAVVRGMSAACRAASCALLGGETAEMPGFYQPGDYDLAGFIVGVVDEDRVLTGSAIRPGDRLLGLPSEGLHTNGYSLARQVIFQRQGLSLGDRLPDTNLTIGQALLAPHRSYLTPLGELLSGELVHGLSHITGGGITDNLPRILPAGCGAELFRNSWPVPPLFRHIQAWGEVAPEEMERTFNLGIGMIVVVDEAQSGEVKARLERAGESVFSIGRIVAGASDVVFLDKAP